MPPADAASMTSAELRRQLLEESDDEEEGGRRAPPPATSDHHANAATSSGHDDGYTPFPTHNPASSASAGAGEGESAAAATAKGLAAASAISGLDALLTAAGLDDCLADAGAWCEAHGWLSVAHLRSGGERAAEALVGALRLKSESKPAKKLRKALRKDVWAWDAHAAAARASSAPAGERG